VGDGAEDEAMTGAGRATPPPPSPELLAAVANGGRVRTRRPARALALVALASLAYAGLWLLLLPVRRDLPYLPHLWWGVVALAWLGGFVAPLTLAIVPRRRAVLPDSGRAGAVAVAAASLLAVVGFALTPAAPPHTGIPVGAPALARSIAHCFAFGLAFALVPLVAGALALRKLLLVGGARLVAAVGAAAGAFGGLVLHLVCPLGGAWHVGCGHAGTVVAAAAIGAVVGALLGRRPA
jgi:hypothetical protein